MTNLRLPTLRLPLAALALALFASACADQNPAGPELQRLSEGPRAAASADWNGRIRIGVVPNASSVALGGTGDYVITNKATGDVLYTGSGTDVQVTVESAAVVRKYWYLQVACTGSATTRDNWAAAAEAAGYHVILETPSCTRLRIGRLSDADYQTPANRTAFINEITAAGLNLGGGTGLYAYTFTEGETQYSLATPAGVVTSTGAPLVTATTGQVRIAGRAYRGTAEAGLNGSGNLAGINELPIEEYLYGVVPRELGPNAFPELEALKAQAVAARTYSVRGIGKRASEGFDLLPTTTDQVYGGYQDEHPLSTQAVDETRGVVATYNGALIDALYSSTSGGHTADSEEAYANAFPYLRGVEDSKQAFKRWAKGKDPTHGDSVSLAAFKGDPTAKDLRKKGNQDFEADWSVYHRWSFEWTNAEISAALSSWKGFSVGEVHAINVLERGPSGRVTRIEYVTDAGTFVALKDGIRTSLRFINASGGFSSMLSTLFVVEPVVDKHTGALEGFSVYGGGWGHGVGLSQTGAVGMAEDGYTFDEILKYYYRGIDLAEWY